MEHRGDKAGSMVVAAIAVMAGFVAACAADEPMDAEDREVAGLESEPGDLDIASVEAEGDVTTAAGCSFIQWCDEPGARGTICRQTGCSRRDAGLECLEEAENVCGGATCPFMITTASGTSCDLCTQCCGVFHPPDC